jgi:hypothetical protein
MREAGVNRSSFESVQRWANGVRPKGYVGCRTLRLHWEHLDGGISQDRLCPHPACSGHQMAIRDDAGHKSEARSSAQRGSPGSRDRGGRSSSSSASWPPSAEPPAVFLEGVGFLHVAVTLEEWHRQAGAPISRPPALRVPDPDDALPMPPHQLAAIMEATSRASAREATWARKMQGIPTPTRKATRRRKMHESQRQRAKPGGVAKCRECASGGGRGSTAREPFCGGVAGQSPCSMALPPRL